MIFLKILKITGIILALILCILLAIILLILFCPVGYHLYGTELYENKKNVSRIHIKLSWIFHLIGLNVSIDPELSARLRILFFNKNLISDSKHNENRDESATDGAGTADSADSDMTDIDDDSDTHDDADTHDDVGTNADVDSDADADTDDTTSSGDSSEDKTDKKENIKRITAKFKNIMEDSSCKQAVEKIKTEFIKLLGAILPYKLGLNAAFSTGSPDKTGMVLGVLAMFPVGYRNRWKIRPDFEKEDLYIDSSFDIRGRIFLYKIVIIAIRIFIDKNCRKLYNEIRK